MELKWKWWNGDKEYENKKGRRELWRKDKKLIECERCLSFKSGNVSYIDNGETGTIKASKDRKEKLLIKRFHFLFKNIINKNSLGEITVLLPKILKFKNSLHKLSKETLNDIKIVNNQISHTRKNQTYKRLILREELIKKINKKYNEKRLLSKSKQKS